MPDDGNVIPDDGPIPRIPPHSIPAEKALLGSVLIDANALADVRGLIDDAHWYFPYHRLIWRALCAMADDHEAIDLATVRDRLEAQGIYEQVGGTTYFVDLAESVPSSANAMYYARIVMAHARRRHLIRTGQQLIEGAFEKGTDVDELVEKTATALEKSAPSITTDDDALAAIRRFESLKNQGKNVFLSTGVVGLDNDIGGFPQGELTVIAARPSVGKTTLTMMLLRRVLQYAHAPVAMFSLEMTREQFGPKLVSIAVGESESQLRTGNLRNEQAATSLTQAKSFYRAHEPLYLYDRIRRCSDLCANIRRLQRTHGIVLAAVDYAQLISGADRGERRYDALCGYMDRLKGLAQETGLPIVVVSQLNRASETRADGMPRIADLRDGGMMEEHAGAIWLLHGEDGGQALVISVAKNRLGKVKAIRVWFRPDTARFGPIEMPDMAW